MSKELIHLNNISKSFDGQMVLDELNLTIHENEFVTLLGPSGCGKTTLIKLLLAFYRPQAGNICIGNSNLQSININSWRNICGAVLQNGCIFSGTIAENIALDTAIDKERLGSAAHTACIDDFIATLPANYNTRIGGSGLELSQGQKQRILIARAVYKNPPFILLDEATNALDAKNERVIVENLARFYKGRTVVVVAHRLSTVRDADKIIVLDGGRVAETGSHESLIRKQGAYYTLVKNQLELGN